MTDPKLTPENLAAVAAAAIAAGNGRRVSGIKLQPQEETNWCWAAVTQSVLNKLRGGARTQEAVVTDHLQRAGRDYTCDPPNREREEGGGCTSASCEGSCNDMHSLKRALSDNGLFSNTLSSQGPPQFGDVRDEINGDFPVPSRIKWTSGDGHVILVIGWFMTPGGDECVIVLDPGSQKRDGSFVREEPMLYTDYAYEYRLPGKLGEVENSYQVR